MKILLIDANEQRRCDTAAALIAQGYRTDDVADGEEGMYMARQGGYDLLVAAADLPPLKGVALIARLRSSGLGSPVLLLIEGGGAAERTQGLDCGADDCLAAPFDQKELLARVRALLRRPRAVSGSKLHCGVLTLDTGAKAGWVGTYPLQLTAKEYELLEYLLLNRQQVLSRQQLFDRVWGFESDTGLGIVDLYVHYLRKKLLPFGLEALIHTVRGAGFMVKDDSKEGVPDSNEKLK